MRGKGIGDCGFKFIVIERLEKERTGSGFQRSQFISLIP